MSTTYLLGKELDLEGYAALLRHAASRCTQAVLVLRDELGIGARARELLDALRVDVVSDARASEWPGTSLLGHEARVLRWRTTPQVVEALVTAARGPFSWQQPELPEDLSFVRDDGRPFLVTIAHEGDLYLDLDADEWRVLETELPSVTDRFRNP